jgi:two-component system, LytTR family, response regulator
VTTESPVRVAIVDDEPEARERLRALLGDSADARIVASCGDGADAVRTLGALAATGDSAELVFLDVQMPELDGFAVVEALADLLGAERVPAIVFVTAFDAYAIRAFDVHAVDYLLKPFDESRFRTALGRARERVAARRAAPDETEPVDASLASRIDARVDARLESLLTQLRAEGRVPDEPLARIAIRETDRVTYVSVADVDWLEADDNYVRVHAGGRARLVRETLKSLEARLDPRRFARVHRSAIVNLERVRELRPTFNGEYVLVLATGARLTLSRGYRDAFLDRMQKG